MRETVQSSKTSAAECEETPIAAQLIGLDNQPATVVDMTRFWFGLDQQLVWLREIGFVDVDCHWKWRELALLAGRRA
jgi:hypothetical protein